MLTTCFKYFLVKFFYSIKEKNRNGKPSNFQIMQTILLLALLGYAVYSTPPHSLTMGTSCNWYVLSASKFHFCFWSLDNRTNFFLPFMNTNIDVNLLKVYNEKLILSNQYKLMKLIDRFIFIKRQVLNMPIHFGFICMKTDFVVLDCFKWMSSFRSRK